MQIDLVNTRCLLWPFFLHCCSLSVFLIVFWRLILTKNSHIHRGFNDQTFLLDVGLDCAFVFCLLSYKHVERILNLRKLFANFSGCLEPQHSQEDFSIAIQTILLWIWLEQSDRLACMNSILSTPRAICYFWTFLRSKLSKYELFNWLESQETNRLCILFERSVLIFRKLPNCSLFFEYAQIDLEMNQALTPNQDFLLWCTDRSFLVHWCLLYWSQCRAYQAYTAVSGRKRTVPGATWNNSEHFFAIPGSNPYACICCTQDFMVCFVCLRSLIAFHHARRKLYFLSCISFSSVKKISVWN